MIVFKLSSYICKGSRSKSVDQEGPKSRLSPAFQDFPWDISLILDTHSFILEYSLKRGAEAIVCRSSSK